MWAYHNIDNQNGNVTQRASTSTQVSERFVSRGIDNEQTRNLVLLVAVLIHDGSLLLDCIHREVCSTNLLSDTAGFTLLNIGLTNLDVG